MVVHVNSNPMQNSPERAFALQKYLLLHSQHDAIQKNLQTMTSAISGIEDTPSQPHHQTRNRGSSFSSSSPTLLKSTSRHGSTSSTESVSPSPESPRPSPAQLFSTMGRTRRSSLPATMATFHAACEHQLSGPDMEIEEEEMKLMGVNQQIKTTLTELLNCESVRADPRYARWCQEKLMDCEKELRGSRRGSTDRRRGSVAV